MVYSLTTFVWVVVLLRNLLMYIKKQLINALINVISYLQTYLLVNSVHQHCPLEGQRRHLLHRQMKFQEAHGIQLQMENFLRR